jgi:hypothetical protein
MDGYLDAADVSLGGTSTTGEVCQSPIAAVKLDEPARACASPAAPSQEPRHHGKEALGGTPLQLSLLRRLAAHANRRHVPLITYLIAGKILLDDEDLAEQRRLPCPRPAAEGGIEQPACPYGAWHLAGVTCRILVGRSILEDGSVGSADPCGIR